MSDLKGTSKLHGIERNSADRPFEYSKKGWEFKRNFEDYKKKHASFYYEFYKKSNGERAYRRHPNQG